MSIHVVRGDRIVVTLMGVAPANLRLAEVALGSTAQLEFYDWEANALSANGETVASQLVTHGRPLGLSPYYVLKDDVALSNNDITNPEQATDQAGTPDAAFDFTAIGQSAFQLLTPRLAHRGATDSTGSSVLDQHFAVALDDQLITVASIDFKTYPDGFTGAALPRSPASSRTRPPSSSPTKCSPARCRSSWPSSPKHRYPPTTSLARTRTSIPPQARRLSGRAPALALRS